MSIDNATPEEWDAAHEAHSAGIVAQAAHSARDLDRLNRALNRPFGEVPVYTRCLAFGLWQQGHPVDYWHDERQVWVATKQPLWGAPIRYRVQPKPEALVLPSIDWSAVHADFCWLTQDADGNACLTAVRPSAIGEVWAEGCLCVDARAFTSFQAGRGDWRQLIVRRPATIAQETT